MLVYQDLFKERKDPVAVKTRKVIKNFIKNNRKSISLFKRDINKLIKLEKKLNG